MRSLCKIAVDGSFSQGEVARIAGLRGLSRADAALGTEILYAALRHAPALVSRFEPYLSRGISHTPPPAVWALVAAETQLALLDRVPRHAAVDTAVTAAAKLAGRGTGRLVNAVLRRRLRELGDERPPPPEPNDCYPAWIRRSFGDLPPEAAAAAPRAYLARAPHTVRERGRPSEGDELLEKLRSAGFDGARAGRVPGTASLPAGSAGAALSREGGWLAQDEASVAVAKAVAELAPRAGRILDACAGRGVKTELLAGLLGNEVELVASDLSSRKLRSARRLSGAAAAAMNLSSTAAFGPGSFDLVFVDAPCTGLGTLRRRPEIRLLRREGDLASLVRLQRAILRSVVPLLRPCGVLVYTACTFTRAETSATVEDLLRSPVGVGLRPIPLPSPPVASWALPDGAWLTFDDPAKVEAPADTFFSCALSFAR